MSTSRFPWATPSPELARGLELSEDTLALILAHRGDPNASCGLRAGGETALRLAVQAPSGKGAELLLHARADVTLGAPDVLRNLGFPETHFHNVPRKKGMCCDMKLLWRVLVKTVNVFITDGAFFFPGTFAVFLPIGDLRS